MRKLTIAIHAGATTCASEPGAFCKFVTTRRFGQVFMCDLYNKELKDENGEPSGGGWLQRLPACLDAERGDA